MGGSKGTNMPVRRPGLFREDLSTSGEFLLDSPLQDCEFREVRHLTSRSCARSG